MQLLLEQGGYLSLYQESAYKRRVLGIGHAEREPRVKMKAKIKVILLQLRGRRG